MIKSLSPYYVTTPFISPLTSETCTSYTLQIFVWDGLKASVPASATYEKTIDNIAEDTGDSKVNISRLINDYIDFTYTYAGSTGTFDGNNQMWVQYQVIYNTPTVNVTPTNVVTDLFVSGYGYGLDGENPTTQVNNILIDGTEFSISDSTIFCVPVIIDEDTAGQTATIISYPTNDINSSINFPDTNDSSELLQYLFVDGSDVNANDEYVEVIYNGVTITLYIDKECRYTPISIIFQNKEGALQVQNFLKAKKDSISVTGETFESDRGQPSLGNHQFVKYNVNGKSKFTVNSGFVDESNNDAFKQLLLSEKAWLYGNGFIPLNVSRKSLEYKTRQNDRLINYEFEFEYSYNDINNI